VPGGLTATVRQASLQKTSQTARRLYGKRSETDSSGSFHAVRFEAARKAERGKPLCAGTGGQHACRAADALR
jgi:hypothetical protein